MGLLSHGKTSGALSIPATRRAQGEAIDADLGMKMRALAKKKGAPAGRLHGMQCNAVQAAWQAAEVHGAWRMAGGGGAWHAAAVLGAGMQQQERWGAGPSSQRMVAGAMRCLLQCQTLPAMACRHDIACNTAALPSGGAEIPVAHAILAEERGTTHEQPPDPTQTMPFPDALLQVGWVVQVSGAWLAGWLG